MKRRDFIGLAAGAGLGVEATKLAPRRRTAAGGLRQSISGRHELGAGPEINPATVTPKLVDLGNNGYLGHEFIPPREFRVGLREAVQIGAAA